MMRQAIDTYTLNKEQAPQSLQDLVNGHYLKEIPTDPLTGKKDWVPQFDDVVLSPEQSSTGMVAFILHPVMSGATVWRTASGDSYSGKLACFRTFASGGLFTSPG